MGQFQKWVLSPLIFYGTTHIRMMTAHRNMDKEDGAGYLVIQPAMQISTWNQQKNKYVLFQAALGKQCSSECTVW